MRFVYYIHLRICVFHGTCVQLKITYHVEERFQEKYIASTLKEIICHCTFFFDGAVRDWFTNKREWGFDGQMGDRIHPTAHQIDFNRVFVARKSHLHMFICRQTLTDWWKKDKFQASADDSSCCWGILTPLSLFLSPFSISCQLRKVGQLGRFLLLLVQNTIYLKGVVLDVYENEWHRPILCKDISGQQSCICSQSVLFDILFSKWTLVFIFYLHLHLYLYLYKCGHWTLQAPILGPRLIPCICVFFVFAFFCICVFICICICIGEQNIKVWALISSGSYSRHSIDPLCIRSCTLHYWLRGALPDQNICF